MSKTFIAESPGLGAWRSNAKRRKELESQKSRLKKLLAKAELDKAMIKDMLGKKW